MKKVGLVVICLVVLAGCTNLRTMAHRLIYPTNPQNNQATVGNEKSQNDHQEITVVNPNAYSNSKPTVKKKIVTKAITYNLSQPIVVGVISGSNVLDQKLTNEILHHAGFQHIEYIETGTKQNTLNELEHAKIDLTFSLEIGADGNSVSYTIPYRFDYSKQSRVDFAVTNQNLALFLDNQIEMFKDSKKYHVIMTDGINFDQVKKLRSKIIHS